MSFDYEFSRDNEFNLQTDSLDDIYTFIIARWNVQKFQIKFEILSKYRDDLYNVNLYNKLGEIFATIGLLYSKNKL